MKHAEFRRESAQPVSDVFLILIDSDHHTLQSCLVHRVLCAKDVCLPLSELHCVSLAYH